MILVYMTETMSAICLPGAKTLFSDNKTEVGEHRVF